MPKSKSWIVTRDSLCLTIDIFPDKGGKKNLLPHLGGCLFSLAHGNRYLPRSSKENVLSITIAANVSVTRQVIPLIANHLFILS